MQKILIPQLQHGIGAIFAKALEPKVLESLGRFLAVSLGSFFSPTWMLLNQSLGRYLNLSALNNMQTLKPALADFMAHLHANHGQLAKELLPQMIVCLIISILFIVLCNKAGELAVRLFLSRTSQLPETD